METSAKSLPDPGCWHLALGSQSLADGVKDLFCHLTASRVFCRTHAPTSPGPPCCCHLSLLASTQSLWDPSHSQAFFGWSLF